MTFLSANTAAAPKFQGCGLSKIMFSKIYDLIASEGYEFIIGFSNAASTPINLHFGVQLVSPLEAAIGFGPLHHSGNNRNHNAFSRIWTPETLRWRINNPNNPIFLRKKECGLFAAYASARNLAYLLMQRSLQLIILNLLLQIRSSHVCPEFMSGYLERSS